MSFGKSAVFTKDASCLLEKVPFLPKTLGVNIEYTTLKKVYYTNENGYEAEYLKRYTAPFTQHFNNESVADIGQIITISKQRIKHPCKSHDVLTGVVIDNETMDAISEQLKKFYVGI